MKFAASTLIAVSLGCAPALAEETKVFIDPSKSCLEFLSKSDPALDMLTSAWALGYLTAEYGSLRVTPHSLKSTSIAMIKTCATVRNATLLEMLHGNHAAIFAEVTKPKRKKAIPPKTPPASTGPGSEGDGWALLAEFVQPGADVVELTKNIVPTEADIRKVYKGELADELIASYASLFGSGATIGPNKGQTELLAWHTTTDDLINKAPILGKFPGGYKQVLSDMNGGYPIMRFKFVKPGETRGMAYDGLIYVGDRWVIMPKPWRRF